MPLRRPLTLVIAPLLLGGLAGCGSSPTTTPSVRDAALAFQTTLLNGDAAGACSYIDAAAFKAQLARSGPANAGKDCLTVMSAALALTQSTGQAIKPAKDITVVSQTATTAVVRETSATGTAEVSNWKLDGTTWKVVSSRAAK